MLRSLSSSVIGLRNFQNKLDVLGNNIANVNTVGYKYNVSRFSDLFSQTLRTGNAPAAGRGGVNPVQIGLGMEVSSINTIQVQGPITSTGRETDLAIEGRGFFIVSDGVENYFTRDGSFARDSGGLIVNASGFKLMGWTPVLQEVEDEGGEMVLTEFIDTSQPLNEVYIPLGENMQAKSTANLSFAGNLNAADEAGDDYVYYTHIYDSLGNRHALSFTFTKEEDNVWTYTLTRTDSEGEQVEVDELGEVTLEFHSNGRLNLVESYGELTDHSFDFDPENGADRVRFTLDFKSISQLAYTSNVVAREQDGYPAGELAAFDVEPNGTIVGVYTNGMFRELAKLAMASFLNPEGLMKAGSNLYSSSANSGDARIGEPGEMGRGLILSRSLEMSNVDIANEFTEMITASRAFQANTRMISTSDEVLLELINVKR